MCQKSRHRRSWMPFVLSPFFNFSTCLMLVLWWNYLPLLRGWIILMPHSQSSPVSDQGNIGPIDIQDQHLWKNTLQVSKSNGLFLDILPGAGVAIRLLWASTRDSSWRYHMTRTAHLDHHLQASQARTLVCLLHNNIFTTLSRLQSIMNVKLSQQRF